MSDPVTNVEIEDVLSSIRRLVADREQAALRPEPVRLEGRARDLPAANATEPPPGTLVLTPALRVGADPAGAAGADDPAGAEDSLAVARMVARIEAAVTVQAHEFEPDGSEEPPVVDWSQIMPQEGPVFRSRQSPAEGSAGLAPAAPVDPAPAPPIGPAAQDVPQFQHRSAAPPAPAADAGAGAGDVDGGVLLADDAGPIDIDRLRSLIADVLREELAGDLGERITRNVRKLVRREIHRVLDGQD
ncbi:MAG: hypothetical protein IT542_02470 [Rubellimicrobium sp.]|nr:hypothetical protein [Rubellimicrobium sp.]